MSTAARFYDEMHDAHGDVRAHFRALAEWLDETPAESLYGPAAIKPHS